MGKNDLPPRPTSLFQAHARREAPLSPLPRMVTLTHIFTPEGRGAAFERTLPDYQAVSCLTEMTWVKNPAAREYRPDGNYTSAINTDTVLVPPDGVDELPAVMKATLVFLNDGDSFMTWHDAESVQAQLADAEKNGLRTLERMSGAASSYALESLARNTITEPLAFQVAGAEEQKKTAVILRSFRDIHHIATPQWNKSPDGKYRPVGIANPESDLSFDPSLTPEDPEPQDRLILVTLQSGTTFVCVEEYPGEFSHKLERAQSDAVMRLATFMKNFSTSNGPAPQLQPQPQEKPRPAVASLEEDFEM